jgi:hypothetical protein
MAAPGFDAGKDLVAGDRMAAVERQHMLVVGTGHENGLG